MLNTRRTHDLAVITIVMAICLVLIWTYLPDDWRKNQGVDYDHYYKPVAKRLIAGGGLRESNGALAAFYPPGFPMVLAGIFELDELTGFDEDTSIKLFALLCNTLSLILLYLLTERFDGTESARIVATLWATYPFFLWLGKQPTSETPFFVCFLSAVYLVARLTTGDQRAGVGFCAGLSIGMASLVRQAAAGYGAVLASYLLFCSKELNKGRRCVLALALIAGNVLAIAPWEYAVYRVNREKIVLGRNLSNSLNDGITFALKPRRDGKNLNIDNGVRRLMTKAETNPRYTASLVSYAHFLSEEARGNPATVLHFFALKARRAWFATDSQRLEQPIASVQCVYLSAAAAGLMLCLSSQKPRLRRLAALVIVSTLYFWALTLLVLPILRYMVPAMSLLMIPAGIIVKNVLYTVRTNRILALESDLPITPRSVATHMEP